MKNFLERADSRLQDVLRKAEENVQNCEKEWLQLFDAFQKQRLASSEVALSWAAVALARLRRSSLRTTRDVVGWVQLARKRGNLSASPQQDWQMNQHEASVKRQRLSVTAPAVNGFQQCSQHPTHRETVFCVQCNKVMCLKCLVEHGNRTQGHQCADMEEPPQFIGVVLPYVESIDAEMEKSYMSLQRREEALLQDMDKSFSALWSAWAAFITALRRQLDAEVSLCTRELATTPMELLQWLRSESLYPLPVSGSRGRPIAPVPLKPPRADGLLDRILSGYISAVRRIIKFKFFEKKERRFLE